MLVKTVSANFKIAKDFYRLKARLLGKKRLKYHERNVEYGNLNYKLDFNKSFELVKNTFTRLDPELGVILESYFKNGQVDVFPKKAKTMGAFCAMGNKKDKTFILLNHANSIQNVLTMAHEAGHGIQFDLTRNTQNALNFSFPMCTAETSSTFFEDFVLQEIEKNVNKKSRLELLMMKLNDDISTIFRQIAFYNFEKEIHLEFRSKGYLSAKEIGKIFKKHMLSYMGKYVEQPKDSENWWVYVSHFRNPFYVYSYAFGLLVSKSLQAEVKKNPKRISDVKKFLSVGGSISPENALRGLGFNINTSAFWNKGIDEIKKSLAEAKELGNQVN